MNKDLLKILQSKEVPIENQQIIDYLEGKLNADTQHELEEQELQDAMMQDAMEGLQSVPDKTRLEMIAREMNAHLQNKLNNKKNGRKEKRKWKDQHWITVSIATLLIIIVICYMLVKLIQK